MTPPLNIDGTPVSEVTIDGESVNQITVDGQEVFSAIPDSAIYRWTFSEGSGTTAVDSIGSANMSLNDDLFVSGSWVDGFAIQGDGTDDFGDVGTLGSFGSSVVPGSCAIAFTVQTSTAGGLINGVAETGLSGNTEFQAGLEGFRGNAGELEWILRDTNHTEINVATNTDISDGTKHRAVLNKTGDSASDLEIYLNATEDSRVTTSGTLSNFEDFTDGFVWLARRRPGSLEDYFNGTVDDAILFNDALTSQQITDDYNRQPWS